VTIETHVSENIRHRQRVVYIRLTTVSLLPLVGLGAERTGVLNDLYFFRFKVIANVL
jgi:hypothetical protein